MSKTGWNPPPMPQIISQFEQSGMNGEQWGARLDEKFDCVLLMIFSTEDYFFFHAWRDGLSVPQRILDKLDEVILRQAETAGWRLGLAPIVQRRLSEWERERGGPDRFIRLGKTYARAARVFQGLELPPIDDPQLYLTKHESVRELRALREKVRQKFPTERSSALELRKFFLDTVSDENQDFVALRRNLERWDAFLAHEDNHEALLRFAHRDRAQRITPVYLFDAWIAWCKGAARGEPMDQDTVRKKISEAGKYLRS
jgi:hypothetical protein